MKSNPAESIRARLLKLSKSEGSDFSTILTQARAIFATFRRRGTDIPLNLPIGLTDEFGNDDSRQTIWSVFLKKNELQPISLQNVVMKLRTRLEPVLNEAALLRPVPNQKTINAMEEAMHGQLKSFKTVQELMEDLNSESD